MTGTIHAFDFLEGGDVETPPVCVSFGDEAFLKRLVRSKLIKLVLGEDEDSPFASFSNEPDWRDVVDELSTVTLFGGGHRRLVVIEQADAFVTKQRSRLEDYVAKPRSTGVLVLEVDTWQANTRLFKAVKGSGLQIECRAPQKAVGKRKTLDEARLAKWLANRAKTEHDARLSRAASSLLLELVGPEFGLLDQELAKLALFVGSGGTISAELVSDVVGGWRTKTIWELIDAAADGDANEALQQLDRLLHAGEHPLALFGQIAWALRRFAAATRIYQEAERRRERKSIRDSLIDAGIPHWNRKGLERAEAQLIQLGRERAGNIYRWLLEADLALKGSHSTPSRARFVLEEMLVQMSKPLRASASASRSTSRSSAVGR